MKVDEKSFDFAFLFQIAFNSTENLIAVRMQDTMPLIQRRPSLQLECRILCLKFNGEPPCS